MGDKREIKHNHSFQWLLAITSRAIGESQLVSHNGRAEMCLRNSAWFRCRRCFTVIGEGNEVFERGGGDNGNGCCEDGDGAVNDIRFTVYRYG